MVQDKPEVIKHFKTPGIEFIYTLFLALFAWIHQIYKASQAS